MQKFYICLLLIFISGVAAAQPSFQKTCGVGWGQKVQVTTDNGFMILGYAFGNSSGITFMKIDSAGGVEWSRFYTSGNDQINGFSGQQTNDGGYIITGIIHPTTMGNDDLILLKTDSAGILEWQKRIVLNSTQEAYSVLQTLDSGFVITGSTVGMLLLLKTDYSGNVMWTKTVDFPGSEKGRCVKQTSDGGFIVTGVTYTSFNFDICLVKTDSLGNMQWTQTYGGPDNDYGNSVYETADGGYVIGGATASYGAGSIDFYLFKTDSTGNLQWTRTYGGTSSDFGSGLSPTDDGGWILSGTTHSFGTGGIDMLIVKTDSAGTLQWSRTFGGTGDEAGYDAVETDDHGFAVVGYTMSSFAVVSPDVYFVRTSSTGTGECNMTVPVLSVDSGGVLTGQTGVGGSATPTDSTLFVQNNGNSPGTIMCPTTGIDEATEEIQTIVFPNPFSSATTFQLNVVVKNAVLVLFNSSGQQVMQVSNISGSTFILQSENLPAGLYFYRLSENEKIMNTGKLMLNDE